MLLSALPAALVFAALIGLGLHRHGGPFAVSAAATIWVFGPPMAIAAASPKAHRYPRLSAALVFWSLILWVSMPVYFPGERRDAVASGLALLSGDQVAQSIADRLPVETTLATPELPEATVAVAATPLPPLALSETEIALPYEGQGRRLSVPVVFEHNGQSIEAYMLLDTGATYTTLTPELLRRLEAAASDASPTLELHTANGVRTAQMSLLDRVWLGDLAIDGVAIATCDACASSDNEGLLGLNVAGGFNLTIDADREEVIFTSRERHDRGLDVKLFTDLESRFSRYPGGRVEVDLLLSNQGRRTVTDARARITCGDAEWMIDLEDVPPGDSARTKRRLPAHEPCEEYQIALDEAHW